LALRRLAGNPVIGYWVRAEKDMTGSVVRPLPFLNGSLFTA